MLFSLISPLDFVLVCLVAAVAGVIKGMVGFAMPMIMISGLGMILSPELALAGLILPTVLANGVQALRQARVLAVLGETGDTGGGEDQDAV